MRERARERGREREREREREGDREAGAEGERLYLDVCLKGAPAKARIWPWLDCLS